MTLRSRQPLNREQRRQLAQQMARENALWPDRLKPVPMQDWPRTTGHTDGPPVAVWRSRDFLVQVYLEPPPAIARLSVCRTRLSGDRWADNIQWDDLQRLKGECGFAHHDAVEVYPPAGDVVNVANFRHLWILKERLAFVWRRRREQPPRPELPSGGTSQSDTTDTPA